MRTAGTALLGTICGMSMKVAHGHRVAATTLAERLPGLADVVSPVVQAQYVRLLAAWIARRRLDAELEATVPAGVAPRVAGEGREAATQSALDEALEVFAAADEALRDPVALRQPALDLVVRLAAWPDPTDPSYVLILPDTEQQPICDALMAALGAHPYPYWDHTDRPADVDEQEWSRRRQAWYPTPAAEDVTRWEAMPPVRPTVAQVGAALLECAGSALALADQGAAEQVLDQSLRAPVATAARREQLEAAHAATQRLGPFPGWDGLWVSWLGRRQAVLDAHLGEITDPRVARA